MILFEVHFLEASHKHISIFSVLVFAAFSMPSFDWLIGTAPDS
jgi:hypothetical protein